MPHSDSTVAVNVESQLAMWSKKTDNDKLVSAYELHRSRITRTQTKNKSAVQGISLLYFFKQQNTVQNDDMQNEEQ